MAPPEAGQTLWGFFFFIVIPLQRHRRPAFAQRWERRGETAFIHRLSKLVHRNVNEAGTRAGSADRWNSDNLTIYCQPKITPLFINHFESECLSFIRPSLSQQVGPVLPIFSLALFNSVARLQNISLMAAVAKGKNKRSPSQPAWTLTHCMG